MQSLAFLGSIGVCFTKLEEWIMVNFFPLSHSKLSSKDIEGERLWMTMGDKD